MKTIDQTIRQYKLRKIVEEKQEYGKRAQNQVGRASEFLVASDLMRNGYEVYFAISGTNAFDLICIKDGITRTVEVKTRERIYKESLMVVKKPDILAIVNYSNGIKYFYRENNP
jgi:Holliday junction resolvase